MRYLSERSWDNPASEKYQLCRLLLIERGIVRRRSEWFPYIGVCRRNAQVRSFGLLPVGVKEGQVDQYVYIVECKDKSLYTGWTTHLRERVKTHNAGRGAKYTRSRRPVKLVYWEVWQTKEEALRREAAIKKMSRSRKLQLIESGAHPKPGEHEGAFSAFTPASVTQSDT